MITCFGSSSIDLFVRAPRLPLLGETVSGSSFFKAFGGKGANQIVQAALLGSKTRFVGRVGSSKDGAEIVQNFSQCNVDVSLVNSTDACACGIALIEVEEGSGDNRIVVVPGSNGCCVGQDVVPALNSASYLLLQLEIPFAAVSFALQEAAKNKV
jgi:ribokinase